MTSWEPASPGRRSSLRLLHVLEHEEDIAAAREVAAALVEQDPELTGHPMLAREVQRLHEADQADFLEKDTRSAAVAHSGHASE